MSKTPDQLPPGQRRVYYAIVSAIARNHYPPTMRELATGLGFASTNSIARHVASLARKGFLTREPGKARTIRLTDLSEGTK